MSVGGRVGIEPALILMFEFGMACAFAVCMKH